MLLCPGDSPGKNIGVDRHAFLQEIIATQGSNPCLVICPILAGGFFTTFDTWEALAASQSQEVQCNNLVSIDSGRTAPQEVLSSLQYLMKTYSYCHLHFTEGETKAQITCLHVENNRI